MEESIIYLVINFRVSNIDYFLYPYIRKARDVHSNGDCGYRSLAMFLGYDDGNYSTIQIDVASHLVDNKDLYQPILDALQPSISVKHIVVKVNCKQSLCSHFHWFHIPMIDLAFAMIYKVALVFLSRDDPCLCLPMKTSMESHDSPLKIVTMAYVGRQDHFDTSIS